MKKTTKLAAMAMAAIGLASCSLVSTRELNLADIGPEPSRDIIASSASHHFPSGAVVRIGKVERGYYAMRSTAKRVRTRFTPRFAWRASCLVTVGRQQPEGHLLYFVNDKMIASHAPDGRAVEHSGGGLTREGAGLEVR